MWLSRHSSSSPLSTLMSCYFWWDHADVVSHNSHIYRTQHRRTFFFTNFSSPSLFSFFLDFYVVFAMVRRAQENCKELNDKRERRGKLIRIIIDNHKKCVWVQAPPVHTHRMQNGKSGDSDSNLDCEWEKKGTSMSDARIYASNTQTHNSSLLYVDCLVRSWKTNFPELQI